ncbi:MAG: triose-phosphate isomerase [Burkholderiales bacterium]|nr:triose-phosphate isomerase [Burkholderiales bacterium]
MSEKTTKRLIVGNWKMNPSSFKEAEKLFIEITKLISHIKKTDIIVCPPFLYIEKLKKLSRKIQLGAQDSFWENGGAYTGEVSSEMLYNTGIKYVILGHSERRQMGENNNFINKKIKGALASGLIPILCVGESERDLEHNYFNFVKTQLLECLNGISKNSISKVIIAYEPIWAISSTKDRKDAKPEDCKEMTIFIRKILSDKFGSESSRVKIIYGGSVNDKDAELFLKDGGINGLLPGKASLDPKKFSKIIEICETLNK